MHTRLFPQRRRSEAIFQEEDEQGKTEARCVSINSLYIYSLSAFLSSCINIHVLYGFLFQFSLRVQASTPFTSYNFHCHVRQKVGIKARYEYVEQISFESVVMCHSDEEVQSTRRTSYRLKNQFQVQVEDFTPPPNQTNT